MPTLTLNPTHDKKVYSVASGSGQAWAAFRVLPGSGAGDGTTEPVGIDSGLFNPTWYSDYATIATFDLATLPIGENVNSVTLRLYIGQEIVTFDLSMRVALATPADPLSIVAADYAQMGATAFCTDYTHAGVTAGAYNDKAFNGTGIAAVEAAAEGVVSLAIRIAEVPDNVEPTWSSAVFGGYNTIHWSGAANPPELIIDYGSTSFAYTSTGGLTLGGAATTALTAQHVSGVHHAFVSEVADGADATLVRPTNWNADHLFVPNFTLWLPDAAPAEAGAADDEFDGASGGVPPGWTEVDHGASTTVDENEAGLKLTQPTHAGDSIAGVYKAIPTGDFTIWTKMSLSGGLLNYTMAGLALWQNATSSSGDLATLLLMQNTLDQEIKVDLWSAYNTYTSTPLNKVITVDVGVANMYLRIRRSGTTYSFDCSLDGIGWTALYSNTLAFTPTHFGPVINNSASGITIAARFPFFRYVASDVGLTGLMSGDRAGFMRNV